jgi:ligand-binding SRPBCC domain-containing protein
VAEFRRSVEVDCPVGEVFEWHRDTRNAALISPPSLRVVEVDGTFPLSEGDEVSLLVRPRGLPVSGRLRIWIAQMRAPTLIVDEMVQGPFRRWHHEHAFRDLGGGRTRVTDTIHYALPLHLEAVLEPLVRNRLEATFAFRQRRTAELLAVTRSTR